MTIAVVLLTVVVAVLAFLVAGLLRSHAAILRRLHELGAGVEPSVAAPSTQDPSQASAQRTPSTPAGDLPQPPRVPEGRPAADITGPGPNGEAHAIRFAGVRHDTILVFLSSGCTTCHVYWDELRDVELPANVRLVVVTKGAEAESPVAVADVAPSGLTVVMSSEAWKQYEVPGSPYVIDVDGPTGRVRGEGTGPSWSQVRKMLLQGLDDLDGQRIGKAAADARREREADAILLSAGIEPGDPSLYQRAEDTDPEAGT